MTSSYPALLLFVAVYLVVDVTYVFMSRSVYENVAMRIQGSKFPSDRMWSAVLAYGALVCGWAIFAPRLARDISSKVRSPFIAGLLAGAIYGFVVYAVFNGTMRVMFHGYDYKTALRDVVWGTTWAGVVTALYFSYVSGRMQ